MNTVYQPSLFGEPSKRCAACKTVKPFSSFYARKANRDGKRSWCKGCERKAAKKHRQENLQEMREYDKERYWRNRDRQLALTQNWRERNKEWTREYALRYYYQHHEEAILRMRQYRKENREYWRRWREENIERAREATRRYRTNKRGAQGEFTEEEFATLCASIGNVCLACGRDDVSLTRDHVVPISLGGDNTIDNIQPLCLACNSGKGARIIDYREESGRYG